jgi:hypothetical protein
VAALLLTGCTSRWQFHRFAPGGSVTTQVEVTTSPPGADVTVNGKPLAKAPFVVPVKYPFEVRVFERRNALPYPHREERRVRDYDRNRFTFRAVLVGYTTAEKVVRLNGEERVEVRLTLRKLP